MVVAIDAFIDKTLLDQHVALQKEKALQFKSLLDLGNTILLYQITYLLTKDTSTINTINWPDFIKKSTSFVYGFTGLFSFLCVYKLNT